MGGNGPSSIDEIEQRWPFPTPVDTGTLDWALIPAW